MATLFISDLHLSPKNPEITECFYRFLAQQAIHAKALYILGDLFEFWIGDDDPKPLYAEIAHKLHALSQQGVAIYYIHGNRDFMLGERYAKQAGMTLLPEVAKIDLYGTPTLIMHGDTLCTKDIGYQNYRKKVNNKKLQWVFNHLPLCLRQKIGDSIRQGSSEKTPTKHPELTDVVQEDIEKTMLAYDASLLIHGHTHKPGMHRFELAHQQMQRIVLGDWYHQGSILVCDQEGMQLKTLDFATK